MLAAGRKFAIVLIVLGLVTILTFLGKVDSGGFERVTLGVVGLFFAANVVQRWSPEAAAVPAPPPPEKFD